LYNIEDIKNTILCGDVLVELKKIPDESIDMVITSPPYYGLRKYDTIPSLWGGDPNCKHEWEYGSKKGISGGIKSKKVKTHGTENFQIVPETKFGFCVHCGAWIGELGSEPDFHLYLDHLFMVCDEIKRVLKPTGSLWWNIDDSRSGSNQGAGASRVGTKQGTNRGTKYMESGNFKSLLADTGIAKKSLMAIPDRFKVGMVDSGWINRNEFIWRKPNQMPDSAKDRFTDDFEKLYWFTKNGKYYFEQQLEPSKWAEKDKRSESGRTIGNGKASKGIHAVKGSGTYRKDKLRNKRTVWDINTKGYKGAHFACVDSETECLTKSGWKKYDEISQSDEILTYNLNSGLLEYQRINDLYLYDVETELVAIKGRDLDIKMTDNHRNVVLKRTKNGNIETVKEAMSLNSRDSIRVSARFNNEFHSRLSENHYSLLGWFLSEGNISKYSLSVYQNAGNKADGIRNLLLREGVSFSEYKRTRKYKGVDKESIDFRIKQSDAQYFKKYVHCIDGYNKVPNHDLLFAEEEKLQAMFDALIDGDGNRRKDGRCSFIQKNKFVIDFVQELCTLLGKRTHLKISRDGTYTLYITDKEYIGLRKTNGDGISKEYENYSGIVWCPNVDNTTFVARRNGSVFITGNTFPEELVTVPITACCPKEGIVLDIFMGSGTTAAVAKKLGRNYLGIERNPEYIQLAIARIGCN
jgi:site-specific DNA-methyltransferase (cytosine-N4-specific)